MVIGLHGKMGAGKNECARRLALLSELSVVEVSFAWKLKQSFAALFDIPTPVLESWKNDRDVTVTISRETWGATDAVTSQTVRSALQRYGTEAHRDIFGADFWLDAALPYRDTPRDNGYQDALYVVTDVRFPNEAQRVRELGGTVVEVVGPDTDTGSHASEQPLTPDYAIFNTRRDDGFDTLDRRLRGLLAELGLPIAERLAA